jgi:MFS family permease
VHGTGDWFSRLHDDKGYTMKNGNMKFSLTLMFGLTIGCVMLDRQGVAYLFPALVKEFGLTNSQVGLISMVQTLAYAIASLFLSVLADKSGSGSKRRWLLPFLILTAVFSGASALATTVGVLILFRVLLGASEGPVYPFMYASVNARSTPEKYAVNIGLVMMIHTIVAAMLGPVIITQILARSNWKIAFVLISIPTLVLAFFLGMLLKQPSREPEHKAQSIPKTQWSDFPKLLGYRNVILCALANIVTMGALWTIVTFGPLYFVKIGQMTEQSMGMIMAGFGVSVLVWSCFVPLISNYVGRRPTTVLFAALGAVPCVALYYGAGPLATILFMCLGGLAPVMTQMFIAIIGVESVPVQLRATSAALILCVGEVVGGAVTPRIVGGLADSQGLPVVMLSAGFCMVAVIVFSLFLVETSPRRVKQVSPVLELGTA